MKNSKRLLTLLLALVMLVGVFTVSAFAQETTIEVRLEGEGSNANFSPDSDGKLTLPAYNDCIGWTCGGVSFDVGDEIGYTEAASVAVDGVAVFTPVYEEEEDKEEEEKPDSIPSIPLFPANPINPDRTKYDLTISVLVEDDYWDYDYDCDYWCDGDHDHIGWCDNAVFNNSWCDGSVSYRYDYDYDYGYGFRTYGEGRYAAGQKVTVSVSAPKAPYGMRYEFVGWRNAAGNRKDGIFARRTSTSTTYTMPAADAHIYAVYELVGNNYSSCKSHGLHTVTYTDGVPGKTIFKDVVKNVRVGASTPTIKDPVRPGYRFVGWSPKVSSKVTKCVVYEAQWSNSPAPKLTTEHVAYLKGYGKGEFRPANNMTRGEFAVLLYRLLDTNTLKAYYTTANTFSDVNSGDWYNEAISTLANAGVIENSKNYEPKDYITRAEMVSMLAAFYTSSNSYKYSCNYKDVPSNYWAYDEISFAQYMGWVKGYGANTFLPDATITRAEVAAILNRVLDRDCDDIKDTKNYTDVAKDAWYYADVLEATIAH